MKEYLSSIILSIFVLITFDVLVSKTKNGKMVKSVISLVVTIMLVIPIVNLFSYENLLDFTGSNQTYKSYLNQIEENTIKTQITSALNKEELNAESIELYREEERIYKIHIIIDGLGITEKNEHINITELVKNVLKNENLEIVVETKRRTFD